MWESGQRRPQLDQLHALDACYGARGALADMAFALETPCGLPARHRWSYNPHGSTPVHWAWLRPRPGAGGVTGTLRWGALGMDVSEAVDDRGLFVTWWASTPDPAARVHLRQPGWVDFGRGPVPARLGIPTLDALTSAGVADGRLSATSLVAPELVERFTRDRAFAGTVLRFFGHRPDVVRTVFSTPPRPDQVIRLPEARPPTIDPHEPFSGAQYRTLRRARGFSQGDAARLATELLPDDPVTDDQIGVLERGGVPRPTFLRARLDTVYRADGFTCIEEVPARRGGPGAPVVFDFPDFWTGPAWVVLEPDRASPQGRVRLAWEDAYARFLVVAATTVTCRRSTPEAGPLRVHCPAGWRVTGGLGSHPGAWDLDVGWRRHGGRGAAPGRHHHVNEAFLTWFGRSVPGFANLLRRHW